MKGTRRARAGMGVAIMLAAGLTGCAIHSAGEPAAGFLAPAIARAYMPLDGTAYIIFEGRGAATMIAPGIAATNAHNENLVDPKTVIGRSTDYDLLFFRSNKGTPAPEGEPLVGEPVIAYGQGGNGELRQARGEVRWTRAPVLPRCEHCPVQEAFAFQAQGGKGFSGGPVVDRRSGKVVGIVFGYRDGLDDKHPAQRLMYAYDMKRVFAELNAIRHRAPQH